MATTITTANMQTAIATAATRVMRLRPHRALIASVIYQQQMPHVLCTRRCFSAAAAQLQPASQQHQHINSNHTAAATIPSKATIATPSLPNSTSTAAAAISATAAVAAAPTRIRRVRPSLAAIKVTESAAARIQFLLQAANNAASAAAVAAGETESPAPAIGIRLGVRSRGCSGLSYTINYVYNTPASLAAVAADDKVISYNVTVYIEKKSLFYVVGTEMNYVDSELISEFVFTNPKAKSQCGCGESFNI